MSRIFYNRSRTPFQPTGWPERDTKTRKGKIGYLDEKTSKIVRKRDKRCVTCGSYVNLTASHFYSRTYLVIRFNLLNVACQCWPCNRAHNGNPWPYSGWLEKTYPAGVQTALHALRMKPAKVQDYELDNLITEYDALLLLTPDQLKYVTLQKAEELL